MTGFFHFYRAVRQSSSHPQKGCQCPMTGFFHFYSIRPQAGGWKNCVSMPYDGLFSFLHGIPLVISHRSSVSMPYDGLFSFLPYINGVMSAQEECVNALWRAFFISTMSSLNSHWTHFKVSMPYDGLFSFLPYYKDNRGEVRYGVNALWRAFFISTLDEEMGRYLSLYGVNALWRAFFISTENNTRQRCGLFKVSMPYDGLFSFLPTEVFKLRNEDGACVNALWRAFFISTLDVQKLVDLFGGCQCPMTGFFHFYTGGGHE